jgi:hypothetical protein
LTFRPTTVSLDLVVGPVGGRRRLEERDRSGNIRSAGCKITNTRRRGVGKRRREYARGIRNWQYRKNSNAPRLGPSRLGLASAISALRKRGAAIVGVAGGRGGRAAVRTPPTRLRRDPVAGVSGEGGEATRLHTTHYAYALELAL